MIFAKVTTPYIFRLIEPLTTTTAVGAAGSVVTVIDFPMIGTRLSVSVAGAVGTMTTEQVTVGSFGSGAGPFVAQYSIPDFTSLKGVQLPPSRLTGELPTTNTIAGDAGKH